MSNFLLINSDTKINLDLVRSFQYQKSSNSVFITYSDGNTEKHFVPVDFDFDSVNNVAHVNTIIAEKDRYILVFNVDIKDNDSEAVGWMEHHPVIGWERVNHKTLPITTQYLQSNNCNKRQYLLDLKEETVREIGEEYSLEVIPIQKLDHAVLRDEISEDYAEYIRNVLLELSSVAELE
ncbi:MAG: hypothetical protein methR_P2226 [Methyloprofundus sp.]|nr:MAG: hypothetical protein methR_P2226 [Methyloprofundus sp.]